MRDAIVLDFDGVLCDSAAETGVSAWRAGRPLWTEWDTEEPPAECLARFIELRPLLETGYQSVLLMRLIYTGLSPRSIRSRFPDLCDAVMADLTLSRDELIDIFGRTRDNWVRQDADGWLARHRFYPTVVDRFLDRMHTDASSVFIATTKQERFVVALLATIGVKLPPAQLFGLDAGKAKEQVLHETLRGGQTQVCFVEDRLETLLRVARQPQLACVKLYFANWGYSLPAEHRQASADPGITVWGPAEFLNVWLCGA